MKVDEQFDYVNTLRWVKSELDESLKKARHILEAFVEHPSDTGQMAQCADLLHETYGTLQILEIYGGALLAEEMEAVARGLQQGTVDRRDDACEVLMRAILQLPDYLERLRSGFRDIPLVLLPLMNDLRAARGTNLLSEGALFLPDINVAPIRHAEAAPATDHIDQLARRLRSRYQFGLVGWYKDSKDMISLKRLAWVLTQFEQNCHTDECTRLFWVANGLVEGIMLGAVESSTSVKWLLGQVDWQIKSMMEYGEQALIDQPPQELLKNLLFYVGRAQPKGRRVPELQKAFQLQRYVPREDEMSSAAASIGGANAELLETISAVIKEDMAKVEDAVDLFTRSENKSVSQLQPFLQPLRNIADTLGMLGLGALRQMLLGQVESVEEMIKGSVAVEDNRLMEVASALVYVKSALNDISWHQAREMPGVSSQSDAYQLPNPEYRQTRVIVIKEALEELAKTKEHIIAFINAPFNFELLKPVPDILNSIRGALSILMADRIAGLVSAAQIYIDEQWITAHLEPNPTQQDLLADALAGVEYALESLGEDRPVSGFALSYCERSVAELGYPVAGWMEPEVESADEGETGARETLPLESTPAHQWAFNRPEQPGAFAPAQSVDDRQFDFESFTADRNQSDSGLEVQVTGSAFEEPPAVEDYRIKPVVDEQEAWVEKADSFEIEPVLDAQPAESADSEFKGQPAEAVASYVEEEDDVDTEIVEVFIEEADEELATIIENYPKWKNQVEDEDALKITRRSFHTLKGSGRLVGALAVGEFAWSVENLLNRVLEHKVPADGALFALLDRVLAALPKLINQFKQHKRDTDTGPQVKALMADAHAMAEGRLIHTPPLVEEDTAFGRPPEMESIEAQPVEEPYEAESLEAQPFTAESSMMEPVEWSDTGGADDTNFTIEELELDAADVPQAQETPESGMAWPQEETPGEEWLQTAAEASNSFESKDTHSFDAEPESVDWESIELEGDTAQTPAWESVDNEVAGHAEASSESTHSAAPAEEELDFVLYDIFSNEASNHLAEINRYIGSCSGGEGAWAVTDDLMRAMHTLHGSSHMAGFKDIADVSGAIEDYIMLLRNNQRMMDVTGLQTIKHFVKTVETAAADLLQTHGRLFDRQDQLAQVDQLMHSATPTKADSGLEFVMDWDNQSHDSGQVDEASTEQDELEEIFLMEAGEIMDSTEAILQQWSVKPKDKNLAEKLERELHTFKGGARLAGFTAMADLSHELETVLSAFREGRLTYSDVLLELVQQTYDRLSDYLDKARKHSPMQPATDLIAHINAFAKGEPLKHVYSESTAGDQDAAAEFEAVDEQEQKTFGRGAHSKESIREQMAVEPQLLFPDAALERASFIEDIDAATGGAVSMIARENEAGRTDISNMLADQAMSTGEQIRVRADMLDKLVNYAAEVSISRSRIEQQMGNVRRDLSELEQTVDRVREQLRRMDIETEAQIRYRTEEVSEHGEVFDPLEFDRYSNVQQLSRSLGESMSDLVNIRDHLDNLTSESETLLLQQSRVNTELQEGLMRTRLVSFAGLVPRLRRVIRQTARELNKQVELRVIGADVELDRTVLDRMAGPMEHMLRNAIDHGIEMPEDRRQKGKKESGVVIIRLLREGAEVVIQVQDDGKGMDVNAIRNKAEKIGMLTSGSGLSNADVLQFILEPGFSTAAKVTQISGRGVGLDVVSNEIKQLGGSLQIDTQPDKGSVFLIRLPLTLSVSQALIVQVIEEMYAIPLSSIVGITRIKRDDLLRAFSTGNPSFNYAGHNYMLQNLGSSLGAENDQPAEEELQKLPILLVHTGGHRVAFQVDALVGSREIVVKSVGPQLSTIHGIAGATIMGDGRVVLILDVAALVRRGIIRTELKAPQAERVDSSVEGVHVMVVDDSITVRKVTSRFLERHQMKVSTAKDGVDALGKLQETLPDIILLDIEMPRMDGYELASVIRNDDRLKHIPIIMITSRTGSKHRDRAMQIGVNIYMGKPYQEHELIENIHTLLRERR